LSRTLGDYPYTPPYAPYSYLIFKKAGIVYARNGKTGELEFSDSDASTVLKAASDALTVGDILIKAGRYDLYREFTVKQGINLRGELVGSPLTANKRTVLVTYKDIDFFTLEGGAGLMDIAIAMGTALSDTNAIIHVPSSGGVDFDNPAIIDNVFVSGLIARNGSVLKLHIDSARNLCGVIVRDLSWHGFNIGIELLLNSTYPDKAISGNRFMGLIGKYSKYFIVLDTDGIATPFMSANEVLGATLQCMAKDTYYTLRGIWVKAGACANQFLGLSIFDIDPLEYALEIESGAEGNIFIGRFSSVLDMGTRTKLINPFDYVTENSGTAIIVAGATSVTVAHGLATTPTKVLVTPRADIGNVWVSARDTTNITINCDTAPVADVIVDWYAEV